MSALADLPLGGRVGPRILIYHQIGEASSFEMNLPVEAFVDQLDWLPANGEIVDIETAIGRIGHSEADHTYVLTFDDGHLSLFESAFPLLEQRGIPFTLYLSTGPIEEGGLLHGNEAMPLVNWDQVRQMLDSGLLTVGAHSHDHLDMRSQTHDAVLADLERCDRLIEARIGLSPRHFAYPWGHWSSTADPVVRSRYDSATIGGGPEIASGSDPHRLSRIPVMASDSHPRLFARKMWGGFRLESGLRNLRDRAVGSRTSR